MFLNFLGFELIPKLFLNSKGVASSENERNVFKSLSLSYFIIKQIKRGA